MRTVSVLCLLMAGITACVPADAPPTAAPAASAPPTSISEPAPLPDGPKAPPINNETWLNTRPLTARDLDGRVRLIEFWTFGCINCVRTIPAVHELYSRYRDKGLIVVGVHSPEFDYERDLGNVKDALVRLDVPYPVAIDNDFATWRAFGNRYWPALYLIDRRGFIRYTHIGELHVATPGWQKMTGQIEALLGE
jgi:thiol-disulfide isomerase/thioredoxin